MPKMNLTNKRSSNKINSLGLFLLGAELKF
jgi:hypothetical protein